LIAISQLEFDALVLKLDALPESKKLDPQTIEIARKIFVENKKAPELAIEYQLSPARIYNIRKRLIIAHLKTYDKPSQTPFEFVNENHEILQNLNGRPVPSGRKSGRPLEMSGGKKINLYLDLESLAIAGRLGDGNISDGVRKALQLVNGKTKAKASRVSLTDAHTSQRHG
jgi:hypothetical protein